MDFVRKKFTDLTREKPTKPVMEFRNHLLEINQPDKLIDAIDSYAQIKNRHTTNQLTGFGLLSAVVGASYALYHAIASTKNNCPRGADPSTTEPCSSAAASVEAAAITLLGFSFSILLLLKNSIDVHDTLTALDGQLNMKLGRSAVKRAARNVVNQRAVKFDDFKILLVEFSRYSKAEQKD